MDSLTDDINISQQIHIPHCNKCTFVLFQLMLNHVHSKVTCRKLPQGNVTAASVKPCSHCSFHLSPVDLRSVSVADANTA